MEQNEASLVEKLLAKVFFHRKECLIGVGVFSLLACAWIVAASSGFSYRDHLELKKMVLVWQENPTDPVLFEKLIGALKKQPKLLRRYDASIAQTLIGLASYDKASSYTEGPVAYLRSEFPEYASFSETTMLIEKGLYQEALEKAIRLKEQMGKEESFLYFHNLLRIASLQRQLSNIPGEMAAWDDCKEFLGWGEGAAVSSLSEEILRSYKEKNIDLKEYIQSRSEVCSSAMKANY